jgi:ferredoxin--NADP+ reductase
MEKIGAPARPLCVAVVGSGPSGFYAAKALFKQPDLALRVDMFDRLPTPYGLVRGGVAPDHQKIKSVTAVYEGVAASPSFRFFGNVMLGRDIQVADLLKHYDQIIYAVGNESDRKLAVPGEDLLGNHSATAFVGWYNGHPDHCDNDFDLSQEGAAIVGIGNVAMDVTRILAQDPEPLASTDMTDYAVNALRKSRVKVIYLLGRRGPAQAAYSPAEIQEIGELSSADIVVDPKEAELDELSLPRLSDATVKKNVEYTQELARKGPSGKKKQVILRFLVSPVEVLGKDGRVQSLKIERNRLVPDGKGGLKAEGTGRFETLPVGLVFRSVGYRGVPIAGVPFDEKAGKIPNAEGRVLETVGGKILPGQYVVGWAKRGPSGLIGTNRTDSMDTVQRMAEDLAAGKVPGALENASPEAVPELLKNRGVTYVTFADWKKLDALEVEHGKKKGKIREKFTRIKEMLACLTPR